MRVAAVSSCHQQAHSEPMQTSHTITEYSSLMEATEMILHQIILPLQLSMTNAVFGEAEDTISSQRNKDTDTELVAQVASIMLKILRYTFT